MYGGRKDAINFYFVASAVFHKLVCVFPLANDGKPYTMRADAYLFVIYDVAGKARNRIPSSSDYPKA